MKKSFLNSRAIQNLQYTLLSWLNWELPETLSPDVLKRIHMMSMTEASGISLSRNLPLSCVMPSYV